MKKLLMISLLLLSIVGCKEKISHDYKFKVDGFIKYDSILRKSTWFMDSLSMKGDTIIFRNSNGTEMKINSPYTIHMLK